MTRAFTLLETLLALTILSAVTVVLTGTLSLSARTLPEHTAPMHWETTADATMREFGRLLEHRDRLARLDRVIVVDESSLRVRSALGSVTTVSLEGSNLFLSDGESDRLLIGDITRATWRLDVQASVLVASVEHVSGMDVTRSWRLEP
ncbi:MAG: hypothetical protein AAGF47_06970 [Planctomycetota bacterium]